MESSLSLRYNDTIQINAKDVHSNDRYVQVAADRKGKDRDAQYKFVVADALKQGGKILGDRVDQTYAGRQTSEGKATGDPAAQNHRLA